MSKSNNENDQLLQDASTLLMFANAAAKQQSNQNSPISNTSSPPSRPNPIPTQPYLKHITPPHVSDPSPLTMKDPIPSNLNTNKWKNKSEPATPKVPTTNSTTQRKSSISGLMNSENTGLDKISTENLSPPIIPSPEKLKSPSHSYSRGIDHTAKQRNNENAMIAAAALTAAADYPLSLKNHEKVPKPAMGKTVSTKEEDQLTEPEVEEEVKLKSDIPPLSSYQVDPDSGLIGCICGIEDDDGFTIQCDVCFRWQHCVCMGYENGEEVPEDEYKCYYCDELKWGKIDPVKARMQTLDRLDGDKSDKIDDEEEKKHHESLNSTNTIAKPQPSLTNKRKQSGSEKSEKRRKSEEKPDFSPKSSFVQSPLIEDDNLPNKENELLEDGITAEAYQSVYYKLNENDYKKQCIKKFFIELGSKFHHDLKKKELNVDIIPLQKFKNIKFSKINLPNYFKYLQDHHKPNLKDQKFSNSVIQVKPYTDNQKQKFNGISKLSLFINPTDSLTIPENTPIIEYLGEIDFFRNYCEEKVNQYNLWGTTKPKVLKTTMPGDVNIVLDSRFVGNESRFIRKSCPSSSNCRIQTVYIPELNQFKFMVVTSKPITFKNELQDEELRLPWEWDANHPILKLYSSIEKFENLSNEDKTALISYIDNILHFVECGCSTSTNYSNCAIFKIKKATSYLMRSTRKASSISNINLTKAKDELILPRPEKDYISFDERMKQRDHNIMNDIKNLMLNTTIEKKKENGLIDSSILRSSSGLMKIPFKAHLLKSANARVVNIIHQDDEKIPINKEKEDKDENNEIPFPIVPELVAKIESRIDEQLNQKHKTIQESRLTPELIERTIEIPNKKEIVVEHQHSNEPPKVVKKLSFADYKKKMK